MTFLVFVRLIFTATNKIIDILTGYSLFYGSREERRKAATEYESSAQLARVVMRAAPAPLLMKDMSNFIVVHERYVHPEFVLNKSNVTPMGHTSDGRAFFAVTDPKIHVYGPGPGSTFSNLTQYTRATHLVFMPRKSYNRLADSVGDPNAQVTLIHMIARCGSTLLLEMLKRVPCVKGIGEPECMTSLHEAYMHDRLEKQEYKKLLQSTIRLMCRVNQDESANHIVIKLSPFISMAMELFKDLFPNMNHVFITRQVKPQIRSCFKLLRRTVPWLARRTGVFTAQVMRTISVPYDDQVFQKMRRKMAKKNFITDVEYCQLAAFMTAGVYHIYFEYKNFFNRVVIYERLNDKPEVEMREIFRVLHLPINDLNLALEALKVDSQHGLFGPRGHEDIEDVAEWWEVVDATFSRVGVPIRSSMTLSEFEKVLQ